MSTSEVNQQKQPSLLNYCKLPTRYNLSTKKKRRGYYNVRDENGHEGWVWARNVRLVTTDETSIENQPETKLVVVVTTTNPMESGVANHISKSWKKFIPKESTFLGTEGRCGASGNGSDPQQYIFKNRNDVPSAYHDVTFDAIDELPFSWQRRE